MAQGYINVPNVYRVVMNMSEQGDSTDAWTNVFEAKDTSGSALNTDFLDLSDALTTFMAHITYDTANVRSVDFYNWEVGPNPAGPQPPVYHFDKNVQCNCNHFAPGGTYDNGGDTAGSLVTLLELVRTSGARNGKKFLRASLQRGDISSGGAHDPWQLNTAISGGVPAYVNGRVTADIGAWFGSGLSHALELGIVHTHRTPGTRDIVSAAFGSISSMIWRHVTTLQMSKRGSNVG